MNNKSRRPARALVPVAIPNRMAGNGESRERWLHGGVTLEEATRILAYKKWELAGHPNGDGVPFWLEAEAELSAAR
jgi:Protein of unknown function (DUF2934)